jgi:hypothetical protein
MLPGKLRAPHARGMQSSYLSIPVGLVSLIYRNFRSYFSTDGIAGVMRDMITPRQLEATE